jgi:hypothetical protein
MAIGLQRKTFHCLPERSPRLQGDWQLAGITMGFLRPHRNGAANADHESPPSLLGDSVVGCVKDATLCLKAEPPRRSAEGLVLSRVEELGNLLHDEGRRPTRYQCSNVLAPKPSTLKTGAMPVKCAEALTWGAADDDVHFWEICLFLNWTNAQVRPGEVGGVGRGGGGISLDCESRLESAGVMKAASHAPAARKKVHERIDALLRHIASLRAWPDDPSA